MKKKRLKTLVTAFAATLLLSSAPIANVPTPAYQVEAQAKSSTSIYVGQTVSLYVKNQYGSALKSKLYQVKGRNNVKIKKSGNYYKVTGKKKGNVSVTLARGGRKFTFKIRVKADFGRNVIVQTQKTPLGNGQYLSLITNKNNCPVVLTVKEKNGNTDYVYAGAKAKFYHLLNGYTSSVTVKREDTIYANTPKVNVSNIRYSQNTPGMLNITFDASTSSTKNITNVEYIFAIRFADGSTDVVSAPLYGVEPGLDVDFEIGNKTVVAVNALVGEVRAYK
jgi:hypothetical protein